LLIGQIVSQPAEKRHPSRVPFSNADQALNRAAGPNGLPVCCELGRKSPVRTGSNKVPITVAKLLKSPVRTGSNNALIAVAAHL
jgi:hypothetical protein